MDYIHPKSSPENYTPYQPSRVNAEGTFGPFPDLLAPDHTNRPYTYEDAYHFLVAVSQTTTDRIQIALLSINFVLGMGANLTVLLTILLIKKLRSVPNMLMVAMIVSDLLFLSNMPVKMIILSSFGWTLPNSLCRPYHWSLAFCKTCSIWIFALLARDRWKVIVYPMEFYQQYKVKSTLAAVFAIFITAGALSLLEADSAKLQSETFNITELDNFKFTSSYCLPDRTIFTALLTVFWQFIIPFIIISGFYLHISITLYKLNKQTILKNGNTINIGIQQQLEKRKRLGMTVLVLVIIFFLCNIPLMICRVLFAVTDSVLDVPLPLMYVANNLSYYNSTFNPIVLIFMSSSLRKCLSEQKSRICQRLLQFLNSNRLLRRLKLGNETLVSQSPAPAASRQTTIKTRSQRLTKQQSVKFADVKVQPKRVLYAKNSCPSGTAVIILPNSDCGKLEV